MKEKKEHDPAKVGYHHEEFGPDEKINHRIEGAYVKQASGKMKEHTKIHKVAKHLPTGKMYSMKGKHKEGLK